MKRSEVVKLIYKYILHECGDSHEITHQNNSKIDAEAILSLIERVGMFPPEINGVYDTVPTVTPTGNFEYGWKRGWEPENET